MLVLIIIEKNRKQIKNNSDLVIEQKPNINSFILHTVVTNSIDNNDHFEQIHFQEQLQYK